jgi:hypothetical protein
MKRKLAVLLICVLTLSFVGCGSDDITLDRRENELVAEYIAGEMLKFSYDNEWDYTKVRTALNKYESNGTAYYNTSYSSQQSTTAASTTTATTSSTTTATTAANGSATTKNVSATTNKSATTTGSTTTNASPDVFTALASSLGITGATISVKGYSAGERYPMDEYAVCISAKDGYKIVAVEFDIKNTSSSDITMNTSSSGVTMRLAIGGKNIIQTASMLTNDIIYLKEATVKAGETYTAVACFQVPDDNATGEATVTVYKNGSSIGTISGVKAE